MCFVIRNRGAALHGRTNSMNSYAEQQMKTSNEELIS